MTGIKLIKLIMNNFKKFMIIRTFNKIYLSKDKFKKIEIDLDLNKNPFLNEIYIDIKEEIKNINFENIEDTVRQLDKKLKIKTNAIQQIYALFSSRFQTAKNYTKSRDYKKMNSQQKSNYLEDLKIFEQKVENLKLLIKNSEDQRFFYKNQIENYLILGYISDIDMKNRIASDKNFKGPTGNKELKGIYLKDNNL